MKQSQDDLFTLMLKASIDYNSEIMAYATLHAGSMYEYKKQDRARVIKQIKSSIKKYNNSVDNIIKQMENIKDD